MRLARSTLGILAAGLLPFLFGCGDDKSPTGVNQTPFELKGALWHYHETPIEGADAKSFQVINSHYAKDKDRVYFGDTYRKGQEYYMVRHSRVKVLEGADPATFRHLDYDYARDKSLVFYEGVAFPVRDIETFELIDREYARDRVTAYYQRRQIAGSDGTTFALIERGYSKDAKHIFYSGPDPREPNAIDRSKTLKGARLESFKVLSGGYAADAVQVYYRGDLLTKEVSSFEVLKDGYARSATRVYFLGKSIPGADAASFEVLERDTGTVDAKDRKTQYRHGEKVPAQ